MGGLLSCPVSPATGLPIYYRPRACPLVPARWLPVYRTAVGAHPDHRRFLKIKLVTDRSFLKAGVLPATAQPFFAGALRVPLIPAYSHFVPLNFPQDKIFPSP